MLEWTEYRSGDVLFLFAVGSIERVSVVFEEAPLTGVQSSYSKLEKKVIVVREWLKFDSSSAELFSKKLKDF